MSQAELAAAIGVSDSQIGFYEAETNEPGRDAWVAMASAMGVTASWLAFGEDGGESPTHRYPGTAPIARDIPAPRGSQGKGKGRKAS